MSSNRSSNLERVAWLVAGGIANGAAYAFGSWMVNRYAVSLKTEKNEKNALHEKKRTNADKAFETGSAHLTKGNYTDALKELTDAERDFEAYCAEDKNAGADILVNKRRKAVSYNQAKCMFHLRRFGDEKTPGSALYTLDKLFSLSKYEVCLMPAAGTLEKEKIYVRTVNGKLAYSVVPRGEEKPLIDMVLDRVVPPQGNITQEKLELIKNEILAATLKAGHIAPIKDKHEMDHDGLNLQGLIFLKLAFFDGKSEYITKAIGAFKQSLTLNQAQEDVYKLLLFAESLKEIPDEKSREVKEGERIDFVPRMCDAVCERILENCHESLDYLTNELMTIYAVTYFNYRRGDLFKNMQEAYKYMHIAMASTPRGPAFHVEQSRLFKIHSQICFRLSVLIPENKSVAITIGDEKHTITKKEAENYAKEYSIKSFNKTVEREEFRKKLEPIKLFDKTMQHPGGSSTVNNQVRIRRHSCA